MSKYRETDPEDDDEDLDDLDDVLASFNQPKASTSTSKPLSQPPLLHPDPAPDDEDFEASLAEGMESLLRQLAGDHPPGPMPDSPSPPLALGSNSISPAGGGMSAEEEEAAFQKMVASMLSGEGMEALGLNDPLAGPSQPRRGGSTKDPGGGGGGAKPSFDETMRRTMESLNKPQAGSDRGLGNGIGDGDGTTPDLAALLSQLGGGDGDDEDLGGLLDGMMAQLMTREVLEEPMTELASKYPAYLASPPAGTSSADIQKYKSQYNLVTQITQTFQKPGYTDEKDGKEIARLVGEMQDLGGPPGEIMGELPEGFDLGALGAGEEGCCIM